MFVNQFLEVAIAVFFIFFAFSLILTWVNEMISYIFSMRSKNLFNIIDASLHENNAKLNQKVDVKRYKEMTAKTPEPVTDLYKDFTKSFYSHPIIQNLENKNNLASIINKDGFSSVILDLLIHAGDKDSAFKQLEESVTKLENNKLKTILTTFLKTSEGKVEDFKNKLENWYDSIIIKAQIWYKKKIQLISLVIRINDCIFV